MSKNPRKNTKVLAAVAAINDLITANKSKFTAGSTLSEADFLALAAQVTNLKAPAYTNAPANPSEYNLQKVGTYTKLNKLFAHRGLVIKASNYYTSFKVVAKADVQAEVERISNRSVVCSRASAILSTGAECYHSKFTKLKSSELVRISAYFRG